jgi:hypothetical protein
MSSEDCTLHARIKLTVEAKDTLMFKAEIIQIPTVARAIQMLRDGDKRDIRAPVAEAYGSWDTLTGRVELEVRVPGKVGYGEREGIKTVQELHGAVNEMLGTAG